MKALIFLGVRARFCSIEIQPQPSQDRDKLLALYLVRRFSFWVSPMQKILFAYIKILFAYTKDTFVDLLNTEPVSGSGSQIQISCIEHNLG